MTFAEALKEYSVYYNRLNDKDNLAHADLVCFINECLKMKDFNKPLQEETEDIIGKLWADMVDERVNIMANLIEGWQNLNITTNDERTMFSRWFALMITSTYIDVLCLYKNKENREMNKYAMLFMPRDTFFETAVKCSINIGECHNIFEMIEGSLGYNGPMKLKPTNETPGYLYALAKYLQENPDICGNPFKE